MPSSDDTEDRRSTAEALDLAVSHLARLTRERGAVCAALGVPEETVDLSAVVRDRVKTLSAENATLRAASNADHMEEEPTMPDNPRPDIEAARRALRAQIAREERRERCVAATSGEADWRSAIHPDHQDGGSAAWALVEGTLLVGVVGLLAWIVAVAAG